MSPTAIDPRNGCGARFRPATLAPAAHKPAAHHRLRLRNWISFSTLVSFVAGLLTNLRFQFGGKASAGETLLAIVAALAVIANIGNRRFWNRRMMLVIYALAVSFCGYILSDLINSTPPDRLIRGWARMGFVIVDFIAIWALVRNKIANLFAICVGEAFSSLLSYGVEYDDFLYNYKFHLALPITVAVMILMPLLFRRWASMATGCGLIAVGVCHLWLDFRIAGAICIVIGFTLTARSMAASGFRGLNIALLAMGLIASSIAIANEYVVSNPAFAGRRQGSNSARTSMALAGINAIKRSPLFGLGSWVWDTEMWNVYLGGMGRGGLRDMITGENAAPHSQIIQSWAEAGVLGVLFFLYFGKLLWQALWQLFYRRPLDFMSPLFLYYLLISVWNLLFSPFANLHRFAIGLSLVISIQVLRERRTAATRTRSMKLVSTHGRPAEGTA